MMAYEPICLTYSSEEKVKRSQASTCVRSKGLELALANNLQSGS